MSELAARIEITNPTGLHARPAVKLTKLAKTFPDAAVQIAVAEAGPWIDAKSVVKVMAMKAARGTFLYLRATGAQAQAAMDALSALVLRDFDEGPGHEAA